MSVMSLRRQRRRYKGKVIKRVDDADLVYERPNDWPQLPEVLASEHKIVGLVKIEDHDMNHLGISITQGSGTFHVDWGDGTSSNTASGGAASHQYTYSDAALGNPTSEGFKVAIVTVTSNTGVAFTAINLNIKPSAFGANNNISSPWLELRMSTPSISNQVNFTLCGASSIVHRNLRQFEYIGDCQLTAGASMFVGLVGLENLKVPRNFTTNMNTVGSFLNGCSRLRYCPDLDTHNSTNFSSMFVGCASLRRVPVMDTSGCSNFASMFSGCTMLEEVPLFDTSQGTTFASMFLSCSKLKTVPAFNTGLGVNLTSMFQNCSLLQSIPTFNTSSANSVNLMFSGCSQLRIIPALDFSAVNSAVNAANVFNTCTSMTKNLSSGLKYTHTLPGQMSSADLDVYYTNLGTASSQTLTVTGNVVTTDTPTIATAKGWTVTGS